MLVLSGTNTFNGQINIVGGELSFATQANLGTGNIAFAGGGNGGGLQYTGTGPLTLTNTFTTGNNNLGFDITNAAGSLTVASNLSPGGNSFFKFGAGTLNYSGSNFNTVNFYVGNTPQLVNQTNGTLNLTTAAPSGNVATTLQITNGTVNFNPGGSATPLFNYSGALTFNRGATIGLNKGTNTTETLNFATNNFTRNAAGSTLTFAPTGGFATFGASETVTTGSAPTLLRGILNPSIVVQDTSANNYSGDFVTTSSGTNSNKTLLAAGSVSGVETNTSAGGSAGAAQFDAGTLSTQVFNVNGGVTLTGGEAAYSIKNSNQTIALGANTLTLGEVAATTTTSATTASKTVNVTSATGFVVGDQLYSNGVSTGATITAISGTTITTNNNVTIASGATVNDGANQVGIIMNGGSITSSSTGALSLINAEGVIYTSNAGGTISSVISGAGGLTTFGPGTLTLGSGTANTYSGTTTINGGTVKVAASSTNALGGPNNNLTINAGTLDVNGNTGLRVFNSLNGTSKATLTNSNTSSPFTLTIGNNGGSGLYSGAITGALGITKGSTGYEYLDGGGVAGTNNYTGTTSITNGAINFGAGMTGLSANSNISLGFNNTNIAAVVEGSGTFTDGLGAGAGQIQFASISSGNYSGNSAGFAAQGGALTVALGGTASPTSLLWGSTYFNPAALAFGYNGSSFAQSDNKVIFQNSLDINGGNRTVMVNTVNYNSAVNQGQYGLDSALLSGNLTDAAGSATINTDSFTSTANVASGLMQLSGTASDLKNAKFNASVGTTQFLSGASLTTKGSLNDTGKVIVDNGATVTFGGDNTAANANYVGNNSVAQNTLQIDGGTVNVNNSNTGGTGSGNGWLFGGAGSGTTNGAINMTAGALNVGTFLSLAGTPNTTAGSAPTGNNSTFSLNMDGGAVTIGGGTGSVGAGVNGALYLKGNAGDTAATGGQAIVNLNGGTLALTQIIMGGGTGSESVFNFNGGTLQAKGSGQTYPSFIAAPGATTGGQYVVETGGAIIDSNSNAITVAAPLLGTTGDGGLTKVGTGTLTLTGTNTYSGTTTVSAGELRLDNTSGSGSGTGTGAVNLRGGTTAVLSGTGSAAGLVTVTNGSVLAPGDNASGNVGTVGTLGVGTTGGLTLTSATLDFDLSSTDTTAGGGINDLLTTGALSHTAGGALNFNFNELGNTLQTGTAYTLISASNVTNFSLSDFITMFTGSNPTSYNATYSLMSNNLDVTFNPAVAPEPSQFVAFGIGLLGLGGLALRARRRQGTAPKVA